MLDFFIKTFTQKKT